MYVRAELDKIKDKKEKSREGKQKLRLRQLLGDEDKPIQKYANPVATR